MAYRAPTSGEMFDDELNLAIEWEWQDEGDGRCGYSVSAFDRSGNQVSLSAGKESFWLEQVKDHIRDLSDGYGDHLHEQARDRRMEQDQ